MTALILLFISGLAEFLKDLSSEGKLGKGYWDKNHEPMVRLEGVWYTTEYAQRLRSYKPAIIRHIEEEMWWKVHWLQGGFWNNIPVFLRKYLFFRDGWHLLKFFSVNGWALAMAFVMDVEPCYLWDWEIKWWAYFLVIRSVWSAPETLGRNLWK